MFTIPLYIAVLTGKRITDVLRVFETPEAAVMQCRQWTARLPTMQEDLVHPGYLYYAQYGTSEETVRVEKHQVEFHEGADVETDADATVFWPGPARVTVLHPPAQEDGHGPQDAE